MYTYICFCSVDIYICALTVLKLTVTGWWFLPNLSPLTHNFDLLKAQGLFSRGQILQFPVAIWLKLFRPYGGVFAGHGDAIAPAREHDESSTQMRVPVGQTLARYFGRRAFRFLRSGGVVRSAALLTSNIVCKLDKGNVVEQVGDCRTAGGITRIQILAPPGCVTEDARPAGEPLFLEELVREAFSGQTAFFWVSSPGGSKLIELRKVNQQDHWTC